MAHFKKKEFALNAAALRSSIFVTDDCAND